MDIGRVGVWQAAFISEPAVATASGAREIEELGYGAL